MEVSLSKQGERHANPVRAVEQFLGSCDPYTYQVGWRVGTVAAEELLQNRRGNGGGRGVAHKLCIPRVAGGGFGVQIAFRFRSGRVCACASSAASSAIEG